MNDDFRKQIYNSLNLKETDELIEIWEKNDRVEWSELTFDVLREILEQRLGELPSQDEPVFEHVAQDETSFYDDSFNENLEQDGAIIEFEGFYSKETLRKKKAARGKLTQQQITWRVIIFIVLVMLFFLSCVYVLQSKEYFSKTTLYPFIILGILYSLYLHPYLEPYFQTKSVWSDSKLYKGVISSQGIRFIAPKKFIKVSWNKIYRAKRTQDLIILFAEYNPAMAFPRNLFKSEADWQQFGQWIDYYAIKAERKNA